MSQFRPAHRRRGRGQAGPGSGRGRLRQQFVTGEHERAGFASLLTQLADQQGPAVFHCTAGKDRTGWTSYLLLSIAGVDQNTIMSDYLARSESTRSPPLTARSTST